ncbi:MAG TPA: hypothetical protein VM144_00845 [Aestuariivirga sp.]|nr:hypothetical protein [Aestuariivirga sp.]
MSKTKSSSRKQNEQRLANDYAGGGSDKSQSAANPAPQKGMIDDDMGKYGGVEQKQTPKEVDPEHRKVSGGGSPGSFHGKQARSSGRGKKYP